MRANPRTVRWALLLTAAAMAAVVLGTALWSYTGARSAAVSVTRSSALHMLMATRRAVRLSGSVDSVTLQDVLTEEQAQGLRYLAVTKPDSTLVASAGAPAPSSLWPPATHLGPAGWFSTTADNRRIRVDTPLWEGHNRPSGPGEPREASSETERGASGGHGGLWHALRNHRLIIEMEPVTARMLASRARLVLLAGLAASSLLLGLSWIFWRVSRRAEEGAAQLAHDGQLKVLGQMSAVLGHELRNPLTSLKGHVQLLLEKLPPEHPGRRGAETVLRETVRIEALAKQVLEFARTGAVQGAWNDPVALARAAADSLGDPRIQLAINGELRPWWLDRARMEEVLVNLLRNALEASPDNGAVELAVIVRPTQELLYEVRDHGDGIPPGEEERVFEPFYTRRTKGTGLGLAVAQRIVECHGGSVTAENRAEGGALFRVRLPWQAGDQPVAGDPGA